MAFLSDYKEFPIGYPIIGAVSDPESQGYVYVIGFDEAGIVKIGSAISVGCRLVALQGGSPFELKVLAAVSIYDVEPCRVEWAAHRLAKKMGTHIRGEWFELEPDDALRCIIEAARSKRTRYGPFTKGMKDQQAALANDNAAADQVRREKLQKKLGMT